MTLKKEISKTHVHCMCTLHGSTTDQNFVTFVVFTCPMQLYALYVMEYHSQNTNV